MQKKTKNGGGGAGAVTGPIAAEPVAQANIYSDIKGERVKDLCLSIGSPPIVRARRTSHREIGEGRIRKTAVGVDRLRVNKEEMEAWQMPE